jgi:threonine synthase
MKAAKPMKMHLACPSCRREFEPGRLLFACPEARPGQEHILRKTLQADGNVTDRILSAWQQGSGRSFEIFRWLNAGHFLLGEKRYLPLLDRLGERLQKLEGQDFLVTPLSAGRDLAQALGRSGRVWVKNEIHNITGSHKGRHLMGSLLYLEALRTLENRDTKQGLAVYSCGNAALAASAVARAGAYELHAFVPEDVDPVVADMLQERGAIVERIARTATGGGDPCYLAFRQAISDNGWLPFACAGNDNWSNIDGGSTLGWELMLQLADQAATLSAIVVQVGGGALARAVAQALEEGQQLRILQDLPQIHVCQPEGGFPFVRAYLLVLADIARQGKLTFDLRYDRTGDPVDQLKSLVDFCRLHRDQILHLVEFVCTRFDSTAVRAVLDRLPEQPVRYMWPWDGAAPGSLAHGILDDVTYDWYYLLLAVLKSGGTAEILPEEAIRRAHRLAHERAGIRTCATGSAGLAGLMQLQEAGCIQPGQDVGLLFTGIDRTGAIHGSGCQDS